MKRLPDRAAQILGYVVLALATVFGTGTIILAVTAGDIGWTIQVAILLVAFLATTALAMRAQPANTAVWALLGAGFFGSASSFGSQLASARTGIDAVTIEAGDLPGSPADYDLITAIGINVSLWAWIPAAMILATILLILFPNGVIPSRRWRIAMWVTMGSITALSLQGAIKVAPWVETTYEELLAAGEGTTMSVPIGYLFIPLMAIAFASVVRIVRAYRRSEGEERLQYRWVVWALGLYVAIVVGGFGLLQSLGDVGGVINNLLLANIPISIGFAITKYRLYEIDAVISRTFVYGALAAFIGGVYVAIVVGIGQLIGSGDEPNTGLALAATAIVAVAFQPLRRRLDKIANRLVYGRRATPYEVLSEFSQRVAATDDSLLVEAARSIVDGTSALRATVTSGAGSTSVEAASWPDDDAISSANDKESFTISHDGIDLGALELEIPRGQRLPEADRRLAAELASGMGLALQNRALTASLESQVERLRHSRRRLVAVQDETRRQLERNLHDGAQQQLVALKVKLGLARVLAEKSDAHQTAQMIQSLSSEADLTVEAMREFARGVYPPLLEAEGLASVIRSHARRMDIPVEVAASEIGRYDRATESTVYFCVLEALGNVARHANATAARVVLDESGGELRVDVSDDGVGFDAGDAKPGTGIPNMTDRLGALDGQLSIDSSPSGTVLRAVIPLTDTNADPEVAGSRDPVGAPPVDAVPAEVGGRT